MKAVIALLALGVFMKATGQSYTYELAQQDSMLIYQTYKDEIAFMECAAVDMDRPRWFARSERDDSLTTGARLRLKQWNNADYAAAEEDDHESYGTAYSYPEPTGLKRPGYSVMDTQVKFITRKDGKTETPYVERIYFSYEGQMLKVERIDPVTVNCDEYRVLAPDWGGR